MNTESKIRNCPLCKEEIKVDAIKCRHCGSPVAPEKPAHEGTCPYCKEQIHPEAIKCKHCKSDLRSPISIEGGFGGDPGADLMPTPVFAAPGIGTGSAVDLSAQGVPCTPGSLPGPALPLAAHEISFGGGFYPWDRPRFFCWEWEFLCVPPPWPPGKPPCRWICKRRIGVMLER